MSSTQRFDVLSLFIRNVLASNSQQFQIHGDKQIIAQILPTAPERAYVTNDCYDSTLDLSSITYIDILQRLLRLGFQIHTTTSGSYFDPKKADAQSNTSPDTFVLQYTLIRSHSID